MKLSDLEIENARVAQRIVEENGGFLTEAEYDTKMYAIRYFIPMNWCQGWGSRVLHKQNADKLCVFAAVQMGFLKAVPGGYESTGLK